MHQEEILALEHLVTDGQFTLLRLARQMSFREQQRARESCLSAVFAPGVCPSSTPLNPV